MISVVITTYGEDHWRDLAWARAYPSTLGQASQEVVVHHEPDLPIGPARNAAASQTSGEWLCFLDADDELDANYLARMERAINSDPDPLLLFQPSVSYVSHNKRHPPQLLGSRDLSKDNYLVVGTIVSRQLFLQVGGFNDYPHGFEDWSLWAKCWKAGARVVPVRGAVYIAYVNRNSKHRSLWKDKRAQREAHNRIRAELFGEDAA